MHHNVHMKHGKSKRNMKKVERFFHLLGKDLSKKGMSMRDPIRITEPGKR